MYEKTLLYFYIMCTLEVLPLGGINKYCYNIVVRDHFLNSLPIVSSDGVVSEHGFKAV